MEKSPTLLQRVYNPGGKRRKKEKSMEKGKPVPRRKKVPVSAEKINYVRKKRDLKTPKKERWGQINSPTISAFPKKL